MINEAPWNQKGVNSEFRVSCIEKSGVCCL